MKKNKKVALTLSSGGARGLAHIGVIERLLEEGYKITSIAGSSIGAVVGAFYACGQLGVYKKWVSDLDRLDVFNLFDFTLSTNGFLKGDRLFGALEEIIEDRQIERLPIPLAVIATDIVNGCEEIFREGSMYQALRASSAIPTVIRPVEYNGKTLLDGGVINPLPLNRIKRTEGDLLVAVNVNAVIRRRNVMESATQKADYSESLKRFVEKWTRKTQSKPQGNKSMGFLDLMNRSIDLMQDQLSTVHFATQKPDITVNISRDACTTFEFYRAKQMIDVGRQAFDEAVNPD